jgi:hypothetical protein
MVRWLSSHTQLRSGLRSGFGRSLVALSILAASCGGAHATTITYSNASSWASAVTITGGDNYDRYNWSASPSGATLLADFSNVTLHRINYSVVGGGEIYGVSPALTYDAAYLQSSNYLEFQNITSVGIIITLPHRVTAIGFNYGNFDGIVVPFPITLGNSFSATVYSNYNSYAFFGVVSDTPFSSFTIRAVGANAIDNFAYSAAHAKHAIPEPTTLPLFATGLGLMALLAWRRRKITV